MPEPIFTLKEATKRYAEQPYLISPNRTISFGQLYQAVESTSVKLTEAGFRAEDRLAIMVESSLEYIVLLHAIWQLGGIACPISTRLPFDRAQARAAKIGCKAIITSSDTVELSGATCRIIQLNDIVMPESSGRPVSAPDPAPDRPATILFTSGSSGEPKGVMHRYDSHIFSAAGSNALIPLRPGDRWLLSLPLYHVGGLAILFRTMIAGAAVVLCDLTMDLTPIIEKYELTHLSLVPTQLYRWLTHSTWPNDFSDLKAVLLGGGPAAERLVLSALECGLPLYCSYGLTEMASQVTTARVDPAEGTNNVGRTLRYREISIGEKGRILVRGETLFEGYITQTGVEKPFDGSGWFATSDRGELDEHGNLKVLGRIDNMFVSGGENIQPEQIESAVCAAANIRQAVVVPVEDEEFGQIPVVFVDGDFDESELQQSLRQILPGFMVPKHFFSWPENEPSAGIKVDRKGIADMAAARLRGQ